MSKETDKLREYMVEAFAEKHGPTTIELADGHKIIAKRVIAYYTGAEIYAPDGTLKASTDACTLGSMRHGKIDGRFVSVAVEQLLEELKELTNS